MGKTERREISALAALTLLGACQSAPVRPDETLLLKPNEIFRLIEAGKIKNGDRFHTEGYVYTYLDASLQLDLRPDAAAERDIIPDRSNCLSLVWPTQAKIGPSGKYEIFGIVRVIPDSEIEGNVVSFEISGRDVDPSCFNSSSPLVLMVADQIRPD